MNLVVDIGNSFTKWAIFDGPSMTAHDKVSTIKEKELLDIDRQYDIDHAILCSVRADIDEARNILSKHYNLLTLEHDTPLPVENLYRTPESLGLDRIAAAVAASNIFNNQNILIVDAGTCITYDFVDSEATYHGGNIAPGLDMRLNAMHDYTSVLPAVNRGHSQDILGKTTEMALQNGAVLGIKWEIEGFIKTLTHNWSDLRVILTGGDAEFFGEMLESQIFVDPYLVLRGLNDILTYNNE